MTPLSAQIEELEKELARDEIRGIVHPARNFVPFIHALLSERRRLLAVREAARKVFSFSLDTLVDRRYSPSMVYLQDALRAAEEGESRG